MAAETWIRCLCESRIRALKLAMRANMPRMADMTTVISSLGAAVIGGLLSPLLTQRKERVQARAEVRRVLAEVEVLVWPPSDYREFQRQVASFEAMALLARLPQNCVRDYTRVVAQYRSGIECREEIGPEGEPGYFIDDQATIEAHATALEALGRAVWHPWLSRLRG